LKIGYIWLLRRDFSLLRRDVPMMFCDFSLLRRDVSIMFRYIWLITNDLRRFTLFFCAF